MNYDNYLGIKYSITGDFPSNSGMLEVFEDIEDYEEQEYYVESNNGEWQFSLSKDLIIETIFIYPKNNTSLIEGIKNNWSRKDIIEKLGKPETSGEESDSKILGKKGAWDRYKKSNYYLHIEYNIAGTGIELLTLMLPDVAP